MMKRLAATGVVTAAMGGVLLTSSPALAGGDDDDYDIHQEKGVELNIGCNIAILSVQHGGDCGGSEVDID
jgi:hypothetical protein